MIEQQTRVKERCRKTGRKKSFEGKRSEGKRRNRIENHGNARMSFRAGRARRRQSPRKRSSRLCHFLRLTRSWFSVASPTGISGSVIGFELVRIQVQSLGDSDKTIGRVSIPLQNLDGLKEGSERKRRRVSHC